MPQRRLFGTDGIRGVAGTEPMTGSFAFRVGAASADILAKTRADDAGASPPRVLIGMDTRRSGPMLAHAFAAGLLSRGANATLLGVLPTPGVSYLTRELGADAGVVISASHNPFEDNGIKLFNARGEKLSDELELRIEELLEDADEGEPVTGGAIGRSESLERDDMYEKFLLANAPYLDGMRVGLDCANGAAYAVAPKVFSQLGAKLDVLNARPDGTNINVECGSTHPEAIRARVLESGLEVGVTFDGDADRALLVDRRGRLVTGDHMIAILAVTRHERTVVATTMSNLGTEIYLRDRGIELVRAAVGDRYVSAELRERGLTLGGEQSGHILLLDRAPTGDGILSALQTLAAVRKSGRSLEAWMDEIPVYPQTLQNVRVDPDRKSSLASDPHVERAVRDALTQLGDEGRVNVRASGTEPLVRVMVEGRDEATIASVAAVLVAAVEAANAALP